MAKFYVIQDSEGGIVYSGGYPTEAQKQSAFALCAQRAGVPGEKTRLVKEKSGTVTRFVIALANTKGWVGTYEIINQE